MEIVVSIIIILLLIAIAVRLFRPQKVLAPTKDDQSLLLIQNQIQDQQKQIQHNMDQLAKTLDARLGESNRTVVMQAGESRKFIQEVTAELTKVTEGQKQVSALNDQLKNLNDILKNTKQRGRL